MASARIYNTASPNRYTAAHKDSTGPGDARPTALQIVEDENLIGKLADKVFVVTGVSSGIGVETMRALYATGGHVFGTVRNVAKGQKAVDEIKANTKGGEVTLIEMDQSSLASVRKGAEEILKQTKTINVLVNNAGIMATPEGKTKDGFDEQFGTNHLSHFLLFQLLKPTLLASASESFPSRVVSLTSFGHRMSPVRFDDYNFTKEAYVPWLGYGQSKTASIYFANQIERLYGSKNLHATSVHPGGIMTGLQVHTPEFDGLAEDPNVKWYMKSVPQGASTSVYAALSEEWKNKGGRYLSDCQEMGPFKGDNPMQTGDDGYAAWAYDQASEDRLWKESLEMVGLPADEA